MSLIRNFLTEEALDKKGEDWKGDTFEYWTAAEAPQQHNGADCGVFLVQYAKFLSLERSLVFTQSDMHHFRIQMLKELHLQRILK